MVDFRESHGGRHALQGLPHDGLGGAGLARVVEPHLQYSTVQYSAVQYSTVQYSTVVEPHHQEVDLLVQARHLAPPPPREAARAVTTHHSSQQYLFQRRIYSDHH